METAGLAFLLLPSPNDEVKMGPTTKRRTTKAYPPGKNAPRLDLALIPSRQGSHHFLRSSSHRRQAGTNPR